MKHYFTETLRYVHREEEIATLGEALDLLSHKDVPAAIELLMAYRNHLMESQVPVRTLYDPREDHP